jgi:hypothetical protein
MSLPFQEYNPCFHTPRTNILYLDTSITWLSLQNNGKIKFKKKQNPLINMTQSMVHASIWSPRIVPKNNEQIPNKMHSQTSKPFWSIEWKNRKNSDKINWFCMEAINPEMLVANRSTCMQSPEPQNWKFKIYEGKIHNR